MKIYYSFYKNNKKNVFFSLNNIYFYVNKSISINESEKLFYQYNFKSIKGLNLFFFKGKKFSLYQNFNIYFKNFYYSVYRTSNFFNFSYFNEIKSAIKDNVFLNNPLNLLKWYLSYFSFMFNFKSFINKKKSFKFDGNSKNLKIVFVPENKRNIIFFKWLKKLFILNYSTNFYNTFNFLLNDVFFNFKNSILYKYKLKFYKSLLTN